MLALAAAAAVLLKVWDRLETPPPRRRVLRRGTDGPRVLCLHGLFASSAFWAPFAEDLARDHRVVAPDLLGFGASPKPSTGRYDVDAHLEWLRPVIEERDESPWLVVGHSLGTAIAAQVALRPAAPVSGVVLFNAPLYASADTRREIHARQNLITRSARRSRGWGRLICEGTHLLRPLIRRLAPHLRPDLPEGVAEDYLRHTWHSYERSFRHLVERRDGLADLARITCPVRVVQGGRDALVEDAGRLDWPAGVDLVVLPEEDHTSLFFERPALAASLVRGFEARHG